MSNNELDRLRALAQFAEQVCSLADDGEEARRRINHLITRAEDDIKTKSLEIQLQQSHIALLKQLDNFMGVSPAPATGSSRPHLSDAGGTGPRAISADAS